jgi:hypothetical protein
MRTMRLCQEDGGEHTLCARPNPALIMRALRHERAPLTANF